MKLTKYFSFLICFLFFNFATAGISSDVIIEGKITGFDKNNVTVVDSHGQKLILPKKVFPKKIKIETGREISIELSDEIFEKSLVK